MRRNSEWAQVFSTSSPYKARDACSRLAQQIRDTKNQLARNDNEIDFLTTQNATLIEENQRLRPALSKVQSVNAEEHTHSDKDLESVRVPQAPDVRGVLDLPEDVFGLRLEQQPGISFNSFSNRQRLNPVDSRCEMQHNDKTSVMSDSGIEENRT